MPVRCRALSASRVVVVLPWVPVTPSSRIVVAGSPYRWAAKAPMRPRGRATSRTGSPVAGFYTYGEIARTRGVSGFHNQTLVVLALA